MSNTEYFNNQNFQIGEYNFDDYFNALLTPAPENNKKEFYLPEIKMERQFPPVQHFINSEMHLPYAPTPIEQMNALVQLNEANRKRNLESKDGAGEKDGNMKKAKKNTPKNATNSKKKKDTPKRKRVNYCFEIHRSGCPQNKESKLYCKVFLKGKLQSEVDLIKGARGKWAYTFYDQRKKKKERRYWPSQSSGPVIEDPCGCDKCILPSIPTEEEGEFSSPSTEEATLVDYENSQNLQLHQQEEYQMHYNYEPVQIHPIYYNKMQVYPTQSNEIQNEYVQYNLYNPQDQKAICLKSSNDFQDKNHYILKSSNDFVNHQRPWGDYLQTHNLEYSQDGLF